MDVGDLTSVNRACREIFDGRARHSWPPEVVVPDVWPSIYGAARVGVDDVAPTVELAAAWLREFITRIDEAL